MYCLAERRGGGPMPVCLALFCIPPSLACPSPSACPALTPPPPLLLVLGAQARLIPPPPAVVKCCSDFEHSFQLRNCLLFSTCGAYSMADCLAGGDFDGDEYVVIKDQAIVAAFFQPGGQLQQQPQQDLGIRSPTTPQHLPPPQPTQAVLTSSLPSGSGRSGAPFSPHRASSLSPVLDPGPPKPSWQAPAVAAVAGGFRSPLQAAPVSLLEEEEDGDDDYVLRRAAAMSLPDDEDVRMRLAGLGSRWTVMFSAKPLQWACPTKRTCGCILQGKSLRRTKDWGVGAQAQALLPGSRSLPRLPGCWRLLAMHA